MGWNLDQCEIAIATNIGAERDNNEDCVATFTNLGLVILADGMGGCRAGEVVSRRVIEIVRDAVHLGDDLESAVLQANDQIYQQAHQDDDHRGMGTTLVAAHYQDKQVTVASIGDSRFYRYRYGQLEQILQDQTVAQFMRTQGLEEFEGKPLRAYEHVLTEAVGIRSTAVVQIKQLEVDEDDVHLLCSDGLSDILTDGFIAKTIDAQSASAQGIVETLMRTALHRLVPDNVTIAMVRFG